MASNSRLRTKIKKTSKKMKIKFFFPSIKYCTDNAAMVAITAYYKHKKKFFTSLKECIKPKMKI